MVNGVFLGRARGSKPLPRQASASAMRALVRTCSTYPGRDLSPARIDTTPDWRAANLFTPRRRLPQYTAHTHHHTPPHCVVHDTRQLLRVYACLTRSPIYRLLARILSTHNGRPIPHPPTTSLRELPQPISTIALFPEFPSCGRAISIPRGSLLLDASSYTAALNSVLRTASCRAEEGKRRRRRSRGAHTPTQSQLDLPLPTIVTGPAAAYHGENTSLPSRVHCCCGRALLIGQGFLQEVARPVCRGSAHFRRQYAGTQARLVEICTFALVLTLGLGMDDKADGRGLCRIRKIRAEVRSHFLDNFSWQYC